ncbi:MAG: hypothetical protein EKK55_17970 [Rhodocyclaceae bacterium]|nr:MAG: hypothetical protein EKK55_17970 [Rhodocyclaceae bacterium]
MKFKEIPEEAKIKFIQTVVMSANLLQKNVTMDDATAWLNNNAEFTTLEKMDGSIDVRFTTNTRNKYNKWLQSL